MGGVFDLSDEDIDFSTDIPDTLNEPTTGADNKTECPDCGGRYTVTKSGSIRSHNCNGVRSVSTVTTKSTGKRKGKKNKRVPATVLKIGSPAIASGVEFGVRQFTSRAVPCDPALVPASIPDDDLHVMIDPIITLLWPNIPARAQSVIESICDQEDLILCALAWMEYGQKLSTWTKQAHAAVLEQHKAQVKDISNGIQGARPESEYGISLDGVVPFRPDSPSGQAM